MVLHYLKVALRNLWKYRMQSMISLAGVAVALLCFSLCLYCSRYVFDTNRCFANRDRIVDLNSSSPERPGKYGYTPGDLVTYLRKLRPDGVESVCKVCSPSSRSYNVWVTDEKMLPYDVEVMETDSAFRTVFTPEVVCGSWEAASHARNALVLTESVARRIFREPAGALGKRFVLARRLDSSPESTPRDGGIVYTVQAVIADIPENTTLGFLHPVEALTLNDSEGLVSGEMRRWMWSGYSYVLLRRGVDRDEFIASWKKHPVTWNSTSNTGKETVTAAPFGSFEWRNKGASYLAWITLAAGMLVLLVGLLNFFHFLTGSFLTRIHEYGVRRVNGAGARSLFFLLFVQAALLVLGAGLFAFVCIELLSPFLGISLFRFSILIDKGVLMEQTAGYLIFLLLLAAVVCAGVVARIRRINLQASLFGGSRRYGQHRLRNALLCVQLFICWIFLSLGTALYLLSWETGKGLFPSLSVAEKEAIVSIPLKYTFMTNADKQALTDRFRRLPGVEEVLLANMSYMTDGVISTGLFKEKDNKDSYLDVNVIYVSPEFFRFMRMDLLSGKTVSAMNGMVVDGKLAEKLGRDVLGRTYYNYMDAYTVTGVCGTFTTDLYKECPGYIFLPWNFSEYIGHCYVKCAPGRVEEVEDAIGKIMASVLPENLTWRPASLMDDIRHHQAFEFRLRNILLFFAGVVLVISLLGVYSAVTLDTEYRRKEMAIRKINGAGVWQIALLFARLYIWMLAGTAAVGFPFVAAVLRHLRRMYTRFFNDGILFYGGVFLAVCGVVALTVAFRIREVSKVNPAATIKSADS